MLTRCSVAILACLVGGCSGAETAPAPSVSRVAASAEHRPARDSATSSPGYARGRRDAPVLVVEFSDFGCHYCADFANEVLPAVDREFIATGEVRWQLVPLATASTPHARAAAAAAVCAAQQAQVWAMHDRLFARQREWARFGDPARRFREYAGDLGLDAARFTACLRAPETADAVEAMSRLAHQLGVRVAPTFFVGGRRVEGALPMEGVRSILAAAVPSRDGRSRD